MLEQKGSWKAENRLHRRRQQHGAFADDGRRQARHAHSPSQRRKATSRTRRSSDAPRKRRQQTGGRIDVCRDPREAIDRCGYRLHGRVGEHGLRRRAEGAGEGVRDYQVNEELVKLCEARLPVHALPAGTSRRRSERRRHRRPAFDHFRSKRRTVCMRKKRSWPRLCSHCILSRISYCHLLE